MRRSRAAVCVFGVCELCVFFGCPRPRNSDSGSPCLPEAWHWPIDARSLSRRAFTRGPVALARALPRPAEPRGKRAHQQSLRRATAKIWGVTELRSSLFAWRFRSTGRPLQARASSSRRQGPGHVSPRSAIGISAAPHPRRIISVVDRDPRGLRWISVRLLSQVV